MFEKKETDGIFCPLMIKQNGFFNMMTFQDIFGDKRFNRKLVSLAFPITMQNLMLALVAAADALIPFHQPNASTENVGVALV